MLRSVVGTRLRSLCRSKKQNSGSCRRRGDEGKGGKEDGAGSRESAEGTKMELSNNKRQKLTPEQPGMSALRGGHGFERSQTFNRYQHQDAGIHLFLNLCFPDER